MALEDPWKAKTLLTSTMKSTSMMIIECLAVYFYKNRLGCYRIGDIDAYYIPGSHRKTPHLQIV